MITPPWYKKLNDILLPVQPVVWFGLLLFIGISVYLLVRGDKVQRTAWFVYLVSP